MLENGDIIMTEKRTFRYKQVIILRTDLEMTIGKAAIQVGHGSIQSYLHSDPYIRDMWYDEGMKKVVLGCTGEQLGTFPFKHTLIIDFGLTEFDGETITGIALNIDESSKIDSVTKELKLYKGYLK
jgi:PTH2 family peptidyl-tRNA hydrolase